MKQRRSESSQNMSRQELLEKANHDRARVTKYSVEELLEAGKFPNFSKRRQKSEAAEANPPYSSEDPEAG